MLTNDVRDKLDMVSSMLPDEVETPIIFKFSTDMIPILLLSVQAEESQPALYKILDDNVANPLARVPGVCTVSIPVFGTDNKADSFYRKVVGIQFIGVAIPIRCVWKVSSRIPKRWRTSW